MAHTEAATVACPRCRQSVQALWPWPHWKKVRAGYFAGLGLALLGAPVILADGFIMIPTLMLYMSAIGPLNRLVRERPICTRCGGQLDAASGRPIAPIAS
jgi:ribosomal protein S27AE